MAQLGAQNLLGRQVLHAAAVQRWHVAKRQAEVEIVWGDLDGQYMEERYR